MDSARSLVQSSAAATCIKRATETGIAEAISLVAGSPIGQGLVDQTAVMTFVHAPEDIVPTETLLQEAGVITSGEQRNPGAMIDEETARDVSRAVNGLVLDHPDFHLDSYDPQAFTPTAPLVLGMGAGFVGPHPATDGTRYSAPALVAVADEGLSLNPMPRMPVTGDDKSESFLNGSVSHASLVAGRLKDKGFTDSSLIIAGVDRTGFFGLAKKLADTKYSWAVVFSGGSKLTTMGLKWLPKLTRGIALKTGDVVADGRGGFAVTVYKTAKAAEFVGCSEEDIPAGAKFIVLVGPAAGAALPRYQAMLVAQDVKPQGLLAVMPLVDDREHDLRTRPLNSSIDPSSGAVDQAMGCCRDNLADLFCLMVNGPHTAGENPAAAGAFEQAVHDASSVK